jgi:hypothetical protein
MTIIGCEEFHYRPRVVASTCASCGGDNDLRDYDDAGNVVFCRDCRETPDLDDLWVDLGVGG